MNIKTNIKNLINPLTQLTLFIRLVTYTTLISILIIGTHGFYQTGKKQLADMIYKEDFNQYPVVIYKVPEVKASEKEYKYNEKVPVEVIKAEIIKQAKELKNDEKFMLDLAFCESGFDNLAKNKNSTALGVYQWLIKSWEETDSFKIDKIARTDFKANIREANIKIANNEYSHWAECVKKIK